MAGFVREFLQYLAANKKLWLFPLILVLLVLIGLLVLAQTSPVAPFIYTLF
ncbi:MAG: hypothetical protein HYY06_02825 [Deltaproteobacteria bacterium]|nr:hypothetical protein [Deltaproteobacteria bacterium]